MSSLKTPFGLLLNHKYGINSGKTLLGADALLHQVMREIPEFQINVFPVLTQFHEIDGDGGDGPDQDANVYPLTDKHIDYALACSKSGGKKKKKQTKKKKNGGDDDSAAGSCEDEAPVEPPTPGFDGVATDIRFVCPDGLDSQGFEWMKHTDEAAEHVGNESRAAEEDSIYLHAALVITRKE